MRAAKGFKRVKSPYSTTLMTRIQPHMKDVLKRLLREDIKNKKSKELDQHGEHLLKEEIELLQKLGGNL